MAEIEKVKNTKNKQTNTHNPNAQRENILNILA